MALITCPDCGNSVSDAAPACIHCGRPIAAASPRTAAPPAGMPPLFPGPGQPQYPGAPQPPAWHPDPVLERLSSVKTIAIVNYALMGFAPLGLLSAVVAVVLAYVKRDEARGTWLESHLDWQIDTFWATLWWIAGALIGGLALMFMLDASMMATLLMALVMVGVFLWFLYRVIRGAVALFDDRPVG
ncbi:MAG TPA: hypothetical protein VF665_11835 [Longimicrobium sp.]|jgi:uncharacterized membrane protein|uniref:DUF4870 family protein n=1 Tax=Longimicrobium sp. TaxID=2029185 RepID=UPI002ED800A0